MTQEEIDAALALALTRPKSATLDGETAQAHSLPDQIAMAKHLAATAAARTPNRGLGFARLRPPGAA